LGRTVPPFIASFVRFSDGLLFDVADERANVAYVRELERKRLASAPHAPAGIN
jgi:hypothetical protein